MLVFLIGLIMVMGSVGALDNPDSGLLGPILLSLLGLVLMYCGVEDMKDKYDV